MAHRIAHWILVVATLLVAPAAFAQSDNQPPPPDGPPGQDMQGDDMQQPPMQPSGRRGGGGGGGGGGLRAACGPEIARLCPGVPPGGGRIVQCLMSRPGALSPICRSRLASRGGGRMGAMPPGYDQPPGYGPPRRGMPQQGYGPPPQGYGPPPRQQGYPPPPQSNYAPPPPSYRPPSSASVSPPPSASGPPSSGNRAAFQASCGPDAKLFCAGVSRENQGVVKCLASHRTELSQTCQMYLQSARADRMASPPPAADMPPPNGASPGNE